LELDLELTAVALDECRRRGLVVRRAASSPGASAAVTGISASPTEAARWSWT